MKNIECAEIHPFQFRPIQERLAINRGVPLVPLLNHARGGHSQPAQHLQKFLPEGITANHPKSFDVPHPKRPQVHNDIARSARAVSLLANVMNGFASLDGGLLHRGVNSPIAIHAEIPKHTNPGAANPFEQRVDVLIAWVKKLF